MENYNLDGYTKGTVPLFPNADLNDGCINFMLVSLSELTHAAFASPPNIGISCGLTDISSRFSRYFPAPAYFGVGNKTTINGDIIQIKVSNSKITRQGVLPYIFTYTVLLTTKTTTITQSKTNTGFSLPVTTTVPTLTTTILSNTTLVSSTTAGQASLPVVAIAAVSIACLCLLCSGLFLCKRYQKRKSLSIVEQVEPPAQGLTYSPLTKPLSGVNVVPRLIEKPAQTASHLDHALAPYPESRIPELGLRKEKSVKESLLGNSAIVAGLAPLPSNPMEWTPSHVMTWAINNVGLDNLLAKKMFDQDVNGRVLFRLTEDHLKNDFGVVKVPERFAVMDAINSIRPGWTGSSRNGGVAMGALPTYSP
ncbi:hypothetical protein BC830DRAFT_129611 [Chytriomyces sp. MP71]|nr:hypothetical protein BC830DRAFT_129611 [Chytriomyces sp. MP71]